MIRIYNALYRRFWHFYNKRSYKKLGVNTFVKNALIITPKYISISDNVFILPNSRIEGITSYEGVSFSPHIQISENCTIQQNLHLTCAENIFIGKNTAIAANVTITDINHPYENIDLPIEKHALIVTPVSIGDDCKIYNNVVILPGTKIGKHCVIGANSVVGGNFTDYCIVVGAPAKIIKRYCFDSASWKKTDGKGNFVV
ncbi:acyltransferase [Flavobacterium piscis]|uniref:Acetyltransferase-like isoleucine patch superfamily enzyme n=1 Tax=Flavobacterium piscis TaxID=1114874 RepID=A0ABU1Y440_9FLAO|nr:acyltransferase [Flavobacterium piscis]MDR7208987.1 acetyltransferase-like isoleucine patch superfamily enzyme [Flavobacterium piscis]